MERTRTGIPGLDGLLEGGFPAHRAVVLCGAPGTGKTTFGLQFLMEGAAHREPGVLLSADEKPRHIVEDAGAFGWNLNREVSDGRLSILDAAPFFTAQRGRAWIRSEIDARQVAGDLVQQIRKTGARRLVIDSVTSLVPPAMDRAQAHDYVRSLVHSLEDNLGCTILLTCRACENEPRGLCAAGRYLATGVIQLGVDRRGNEFVRTLRIPKMRGTAVDLAEHALVIEAGAGLAILPAKTAARRELFTLIQRNGVETAPPASDRPAAV